MASKRASRIVAAALVPLVGAAAFFMFLHKELRVSENAASAEYFANPYMGFAPWSSERDIQEDVTLVYADATWAEIEAEKGVYDFSEFERTSRIDEHRSAGRNVIFRLVLDSPDDEAHMDIPEWLYEETGDGDFYDISYGKGYAPNYANEKLIEYHGKLLQEIRDRYADEGLICFVQLGSIGHWGEWHVKSHDTNITPLPKLAVLEQYVTQYVDCFGADMLLMRRPFYFVAENGMGVYNDMTAEYNSTTEWLSWIENGGDYTQTDEENVLTAMPDAWKTAPIGGEIASALSPDDYMGENLSQTIELLQKSHTTFIGPNNPLEGGEAYADDILAIANTIGYRLRISRTEWVRVGALKTDEQLCVTFVNDGVAPFLCDWQVYAYYIGADGEIISKQALPIAANEIIPGEARSVTFKTSGYAPSEGEYSIGFAIEDPASGEPAIAFAMDTDGDSKLYVISFSN